MAFLVSVGDVVSEVRTIQVLGVPVDFTDPYLPIVGTGQFADFIYLTDFDPAPPLIGVPAVVNSGILLEASGATFLAGPDGLPRVAAGFRWTIGQTVLDQAIGSVARPHAGAFCTLTDRPRTGPTITVFAPVISFAAGTLTIHDATAVLDLTPSGS